MKIIDYLLGALYKAKLDAEAKEYEYAHNGMRINFELSSDEIKVLIQALENLILIQKKNVE